MQTCRRGVRSSTSQHEPCALVRCGEDVSSTAQAAIDSVMPRANVQASATYVDTRRKQRVALFHFSVPGAYHTLLWSHGNAMDIGEMCAAAPTPMTSSRSPFCAPATAPPIPRARRYLFFVQLALEAGVNVVAYDYSGYGASSGSPSESDIYADVLAVYECVARDTPCPRPLVFA